MNEYELYKSGLSIPQVSEKTGIPLSTLRFRLKKAGILRTRTESIRLSAKQGRLGSGNRGKTRILSDEWKNNISKAKLIHGEKYAKGISLNLSGYYEITRGKNKGRSQHVIIIEDHIGRRLYRNECVHHINKIKTDNRLENLKLMTVFEHAKLHAKENYKHRKRNERGQFE